MIPDDFNTEIFEHELIKSGFENFVYSPFLQRLKGVSFLATMDHIYSVETPFSRYDHSLGVAYLSFKLAQYLRLDKYQTETLVIANLLHDIGHTPFSHAAETFLLEKKRKYHEGLVSSYLRFNTRLLPDSFSLTEIIEDRNDIVRNAVTNLLLNQDSEDKIINSIHFCSINCDKIDGTNRTLFSLGLPYIPPISFLQKFLVNDNSIYFDNKYLSEIEIFWEKKKNLYNEYIYNNDVLSAEAMLTRALDMTINSKELVNFFIGSTDKDVLSYLAENKASKFIMDSFFLKKMFYPLSKIDARYLIQIEDKIKAEKARFNYEKRKLIEHEIAKKFKVDSDYVISHYSFKKEFKTDKSIISQLGLFIKNTNKSSLDKLSKTFFSVRMSGDVFDVFLPIEQSYSENVKNG